MKNIEQAIADILESNFDRKYLDVTYEQVAIEILELLIKRGNSHVTRKK